MAAFSGGVTLVDRLSSLLKDVKLENGATQAGLAKMYEDVKECYEAQERASPSADYAVRSCLWRLQSARIPAD
jgi:hypothetical protein